MEYEGSNDVILKRAKIYVVQIITVKITHDEATLSGKGIIRLSPVMKRVMSRFESLIMAIQIIWNILKLSLSLSMK